MAKKAKVNVIDNDVWITAHFGELVDKYAGKHIVVSNGEVFTGENAVEKARKKYPHIVPTSMPIPRPKEFMHVLIICPHP